MLQTMTAGIQLLEHVSAALRAEEMRVQWAHISRKRKVKPSSNLVP